MSRNIVQNNTPRIKITYSYPGGTHDMLLRIAGVTSAGAAADEAEQFVNNIAPLYYEQTSFSSVQFALEGSNIFNPVPWTPIQGAQAGGPYNSGYDYTQSLQIIGRSPEGSRGTIYFYGLANQRNSQQRLAVGAFPIAATLIAAAQSQPLIAVDGGVVAWKQYVNIVQNDYLAGKQRG